VSAETSSGAMFAAESLFETTIGVSVTHFEPGSTI
jgi:hypothetical protein